MNITAPVESAYGAVAVEPLKVTTSTWEGPRCSCSVSRALEAKSNATSEIRSAAPALTADTPGAKVRVQSRERQVPVLSSSGRSSSCSAPRDALASSHRSAGGSVVADTVGETVADVLREGDTLGVVLRVSEGDRVVLVVEDGEGVIVFDTVLLMLGEGVVLRERVELGVVLPLELEDGVTLRVAEADGVRLLVQDGDIETLGV